tara:strand:- start:427 stop:852 length:426 start_codon:yes stop_codon:yes gene_type:complete
MTEKIYKPTPAELLDEKLASKSKSEVQAAQKLEGHYFISYNKTLDKDPTDTNDFNIISQRGYVSTYIGGENYIVDLYEVPIGYFLCHKICNIKDTGNWVLHTHKEYWEEESLRCAEVLKEKLDKEILGKRANLKRFFENKK